MLHLPKKSMQKITIPISGVTSNSEARAVKDGECRILHNLTCEAGATKVIAPPSKGTAIEANSYTEYYHAKADKWLVVRNKEKSLTNYIVIGGREITGVESLAFMGNIVIINCTDGVLYALYSGDAYRYLGKLPELPRLKISLLPTHAATFTENKYYADRLELKESEQGLKWSNVSKGFFDACLTGLYEKRAFIDRTLIRMAIRLFDGNYVAFSPIYYVEDGEGFEKEDLTAWLGQEGEVTAGRDNHNFISTPQSAVAKRARYCTMVKGFVPQFSFDEMELSDWKDIIMSIDIFATPSIMGHESKYPESSIENGGSVRIDVSSSYERYVKKSVSKIREEVAEASLYYKIAEYDIEGNEVWCLKNTSPSQLALQTSLPMNEQPHEFAGSNYCYIYNNKMHFGGVSERLRDAYMQYTRAGRSDDITSKLKQITSVVTIATDDGERHIVTTDSTPKLSGAGDDTYHMSPYLSYPDARATNLRVYAAYTTRFNGSAIVYRDFPLTAHKLRNLSYYVGDVVAGKEQDVSIEWKSGTSLAASIHNVRERNGFLTGARAQLGRQLGEAGTNISGTYTFTYNSSGKRWTLSYTLAGGVAIDGGTVKPGDFHIDIFIEGIHVNEEEWTDEGSAADYSKLQDGSTITVTVKESTNEFDGLRPIEVGGDGWHVADGTSDVTARFDSEDKIVGFTLNNVKENRIYTRKNVLRVSDVDNPLFFPAKNTYSFDADIVALCSNTVAVSQGQFGQHPLYVFTKKGVWFMTLDTSGAGSYLSQVPASREICHNKGVTVTTRGVVFLTAKGVMLINGNEAANISQAIAGLHTAELTAADDVTTRICDIAARGLIATKAPFADYLNEAFTAYDYNSDLLYVCNGNYDYAYVYNMKSGTWSTADGRYCCTIDYPETLLLGSRYIEGDTTKYRRHTFDNHNKQKNDMPVAMVMHGCTFGTSGLKRVRDAALRATMQCNKFGFYLLGSMDGVHWEVVGGKEIVNGARAVKPNYTMVRDLIARTKRTRAYRFVSFAMAGTVRSDAQFLLCECMVEGDYDKRAM